MKCKFECEIIIGLIINAVQIWVSNKCQFDYQCSANLIVGLIIKRMQIWVSNECPFDYQKRWKFEYQISINLSMKRVSSGYRFECPMCSIWASNRCKFLYQMSISLSIKCFSIWVSNVYRMVRIVILLLTSYFCDVTPLWLKILLTLIFAYAIF